MAEENGRLSVVLDRLRTQTLHLPEADLRLNEFVSALEDAEGLGFGQAQSIRLYGVAPDLSLLGPELRNAIERKGQQLVVSCFWIQKTEVVGSSFPVVIETTRRYRESSRWIPSASLVFVPHVFERSTARHLLLVAADDHPEVPLNLIAFSGLRSELDCLKSEIAELTGQMPILHVKRQLRAYRGDDAVLSQRASIAGGMNVIQVPEVVAASMERDLIQAYEPNGAITVRLAKIAEAFEP